MLDQALLEILVCPENKTPVHEADADLMSRVNAAIQSGTLKNRAGQTVEKTAEAGLLRQDGKFLYLVRDDIPVMLIDEAVPMEQLG